MLTIRRIVLVVAVLIPCSTRPLAAQTATFDFDSGTPTCYRGQSLSFSQTVNGITATFTSPQGAAFSLQDEGSTFFRLSRFSQLFLMPNSIDRNTLDIHFSRPLTYLSLPFATIDYQDNAEIPGNLLLTAYRSDNSVVGSATIHGEYLGDTYPMGQLTYDSAGVPFDWVRLYVPYQPQGTANFLADNLLVGAAVVAAAGAVPDGTGPGSPLLVQRNPQGDVVLTWGLSCLPTDTDYVVYEGQLGNFPSHDPVRCGTGGATTATLFATPGDRYYLVGAASGGVEGSLGRDSSGAERPASPIACLPRSLAACP